MLLLCRSHLLQMDCRRQWSLRSRRSAENALIHEGESPQRLVLWVRLPRDSRLRARRLLLVPHLLAHREPRKALALVNLTLLRLRVLPNQRWPLQLL